MVALMTDAATGRPTGIHRTYLDAEANKLSRRMLGQMGVVRSSADEEVSLGLGITEGVEDGLACILSGWRPTWAATCAGAIAKFPVLPGIEALTIFSDADEPGLKAAEACRSRWLAAGKEAEIVCPGGTHGR